MNQEKIPTICLRTSLEDEMENPGKSITIELVSYTGSTAWLDVLDRNDQAVFSVSLDHYDGKVSASIWKERPKSSEPTLTLYMDSKMSRRVIREEEAEPKTLIEIFQEEPTPLEENLLDIPTPK